MGASEPEVSILSNPVTAPLALLSRSLGHSSEVLAASGACLRDKLYQRVQQMSGSQMKGLALWFICSGLL